MYVQDEVRGIVSEDALNFLEASRNKPYAAAQRLSQLMYTAIASQTLFPDLAPAMDLNISDLVNSIGVCEMCALTYHADCSRQYMCQWKIALVQDRTETCTKRARHCQAHQLPLLVHDASNQMMLV